MTSLWYNQQRAGEGFAIERYSDDTAIIKFFTYGENGEQMWLIGVGQWDGPNAICQCYVTEGGALGSISNPQDVEESPRGDLMLFQASDDLIHMTYNYGGVTVNYDLEPLYRPGESESEIPLNPFDGKLTFRVKPFNWHGDWLDGEFYYNEEDGKWYAIWSTAQIHWTNLSGGRNAVLELEFSGLEDEVRTTSASASGYGNPSWNVYHDPAAFRHIYTARLDKANRPRGHANANFQIDTNLGTLVIFTARIIGGQ